MYYFAYISHDYQCKNKLEKAILAYLRYMDRTLFEENLMQKFKENVLAEIEKINKANPRCKPIKVFLEQDQLTEDYTLWMTGICNFKLLKTKLRAWNTNTPTS